MLLCLNHIDPHTLGHPSQKFTSLSRKAVSKAIRSSASDLLLVNLKSVSIVHVKLDAPVSRNAEYPHRCSVYGDSPNLDCRSDSP